MSLASFNRKTNSDTHETKPEFNESLQVGIVQQILYSFESNKIPLSRFKRIDTQSNSKIKFIILCYVTIIIFLLYIIFQNNIVFQFLPKFIFSNILYNYIHLILFFLIIPSYIIAHIIWTIYEAIIKSRKLSVSTGIGALSLEKSNTYILDKYLDEILYVFDANPDKKILVLEDMDRFDEMILISMLTKLREINHILNNRDKKENGPVIFIYAIKEELITKPEDRVKFFDFIIPIISYTDKNNSIDRLLSIFSNFNIDETLLELLSTYIYDHRLIQHIKNELIIYDSILSKKIELDKNTLFALLCYKNLFITDFEDLRNHNGYLYSAISLSKKYGLDQYYQNESDFNDFETNIFENLGLKEKPPNYNSDQLKLIFEFILLGYVNNHFYNYISYFIPNRLSFDDKKFILYIDGRSDNKMGRSFWKKQINRPDLVIEEIELNSFNSDIVLNYSLFFYLLTDFYLSIKLSEDPPLLSSRGLDKKFEFLLGNLMKNTDVHQKFINGLLEYNEIQNGIVQDAIRDLLNYNDHKIKFSDIPENTPLKLVQLIYGGQYYIPSIEILTKCYNLLPKTITDMYIYYYHVQKWIAETQLPEEDLNTALNNIVSNINTSIPEIDISPEDVTKVEFIKQILLNPKLQNSKKLIDALKSKNIPLEFNDSHIEQLKNLPFDRIKLLIENDMIVVALFASISTDNKNLSEDEKIMLWNIYITKDKNIVAQEFTNSLSLIFPNWKLFQGGYFKLNNTQDNKLFCKFLKDKEYISKYLNLSDPKIKITNKKKHLVTS